MGAEEQQRSMQQVDRPPPVVGAQPGAAGVASPARELLRSAHCAGGVCGLQRTTRCTPLLPQVQARRQPLCNKTGKHGYDTLLYNQQDPWG